MWGTGKTRDELRVIALRRAKALASQGRSHLAEVEINNALILGAPLHEVGEAIDRILDHCPALISRREALRRTAVLLATGTAAGFGLLDARYVNAATTSASALQGVFVKVPVIGAADGSFNVYQVTTAGLQSVPGSYQGDAFSNGGSLYNVSQSWTSGVPTTVVNVAWSDGSVKTFSARGAGSSNSVRTVGSLTSATKRGSYIYVANTYVRTYAVSGTPPTPKSGIPLIRVTTQLNLQVLDVSTGIIAAAWTGPESNGACLASLKVSEDGRAILLSADAPDQTPPTTLFEFNFAGSRLSFIAATRGSSSLVHALSGGNYVWPTADGKLIQIGSNAVHSYAPATHESASTPLPAERGNNRIPPSFQGALAESGTIVVSNGDGRYLGWMPSGRLSPSGVLPGTPSHTPPFLVYPGSSLRAVIATARSSTWLIDNREGLGGIWKLDAQLNPLAHALAGNYLSACCADETGSYVAALSPIESALYVVDPAGTSMAFQAPRYSELVPRR